MAPIATALLSYLASFGSIGAWDSKSITNPRSLQTTPILLWHGMGDSYNSVSMQRLLTSLQSSYPNAPIHSIALDEDGAADQQRGIMGDAMFDIENVCLTLKNSTEFDNGVHGIGISQGGLFLRALASICDIEFKSLITFGSPHQGFSDLPACDENAWNYWLCVRKNAALRGKMYSDYFQEHIIQAQYFRDNLNYEAYLEKSVFLKWINNDLIKDIDIWNRFTQIEKFVMVLFEKDETLVPKESAWFQDLTPDGELNEFDNTESYLYDLIGLKTMHDQGQIFFESIDDIHCGFTEEEFIDIVTKYIL